MQVRKVTMLQWERKMVNGRRDYTDGYYVPVVFPLKGVA